MSRFQYIFVHGLSGWGESDRAYSRMPYWGMKGCDLMAFLREKGFDCHAASVAPAGSCWDRACELYAQLTGTKTDYGIAHSRTYRHDRYGRDYSGHSLIPSWDGKGEQPRLVLLGHSFGGATIRMFSELLAHGDKEEQQATPPQELSPLFSGGMSGSLQALVTLASPMNGTTAYDLFMDPAFDPNSVRVPWWSGLLAKMMSLGTRPRTDGRDERDYAGFDMHLDRARELNERMVTLPSVFYFSVPCSYTDRQPDGTYRPRRGMEPLFCQKVLPDRCLPRHHGRRHNGGCNLAG